MHNNTIICPLNFVNIVYYITECLTDHVAQYFCSKTLNCICVEAWLLIPELSRDAEAGSSLRAMLATVLVEDEVEPEAKTSGFQDGSSNVLVKRRPHVT